MAVVGGTSYATGLVRTIFPDYLIRHAPGKSFFESRMLVGDGDTNPIFVVRDPEKEAGQTVRIPLLAPLRKAAVSDDGTLEGQEEEMVYSYVDATLHDRSNAVGTVGLLEEQKVRQKVMKDGAPALARWMGNEKDYRIIAAAKASGVYDISDATYPANAVVFGGTATEWSGITETDKISADTVAAIGDLMAQRSCLPVDIPGFGEITCVLLVTPGQAADLYIDPKWREAQLQAMPRGSDNPIFKGALGMINNVLVHRPKWGYGYGVTDGTMLYEAEGGANWRKSEAIALSGRAIGFAVALEYKTGRKSGTDYERKDGISVTSIFGAVKTQINMVNPNDAAVTLPNTTDAKVMDFGVGYVATASRILQRRAQAA